MLSRPRLLASALIAGTTALTAALASPNAPTVQDSYAPPVAKASDEGQKAIARFKLDKGLRIDLWAAEPLLANPVAFCLDEKGRVYVAETFRLHKGVTDNRNHMNWLDDDLAARTVADRVAKYKKFAKDKFASEYESQRDRVKQVLDTDGDGKADTSSVFADNFGAAADGIGSGLLARKGDVYFTCIPDLYKMRDTAGRGVADKIESLATGFGVHTALLGHDLHGLRIGPDGRLYFTVGDRGTNVKTKEGKTLLYPDMGTLLRCELDGSNLEVVSWGLRNPQELAFDDRGDLFTNDNNCDAGDKARWIYLVPESDAGWRTGYQYDTVFGNRGPWMAERLWDLPHAGQPAYVLPPLAHLGNGPSGLAHYPGTGLGERYKDHFFLADFRGGPGGSGVRSYAAKPKGAAFELVDAHQFVWDCLATDCDFGPDSKFYVSDWVNGWGQPGKGRIYTVADAEAQKKPEVAEAKKLLAEGFDAKPASELVKLLGHANQMVRQEAQFAIVAKKAVPELVSVAVDKGGELPRLHAAWGLGQLARKGDKGAAEALLKLFDDADSEIRVQAMRTAAELPIDLHKLFVKKLADAKEPREKLWAALALGENAKRNPNAGRADAVFPVVAEMLKANADADRYLRHAGIVALTLAVSPAELAVKVPSSDPFVRKAAAVAMRRQNSPAIAQLLSDADPAVQAEAIRAVHDEPVAAALPQLAALINSQKLDDALWFRVLNAHNRLGTESNAIALARFAARSDVPDAPRVEALHLLGTWENPGRRDRVTGLTQDLGRRDKGVAVNAIKGVIAKVFTAPGAVQKEATKVAGSLGIKEVGPTLLQIVEDGSAAVEGRVEAIKGLMVLKDPRLKSAVETSLKGDVPALRAAARLGLAQIDPKAALQAFSAALESGQQVEKQSALVALGKVNDPAAKSLVGKYVEMLVAGKVPAELRLDVVEAAEALPGKPFAPQLDAYRKGKTPGDLTAYDEALAGGDAARGRDVFLNNATLSCLRCHKAGGEGGEVGPNLAGIGTEKPRDYLLESLVLPNKQIAKGFESLVVVKLSGETVTGVVKGRANGVITLVNSDAKTVTVREDEIDEQRPGRTGMPEDLHTKMTRQEMRDLVEFLSSLKKQ